MGTESWLNMELSLERALTLEQERRAAAQLHPHDLAAALDSLLVLYCQTHYMLEQAMRRVMELEIKESLSIGPDHHQWAEDVLQNLQDAPDC